MISVYQHLFNQIMLWCSLLCHPLFCVLADAVLCDVVLCYIALCCAVL